MCFFYAKQSLKVCQSDVKDPVIPDKYTALLQGLMAFICHLHGQRHSLESRVHNLVMDWLEDANTPINVGIGAKVMSFIVNDKVTHIFPLN